MDRPLLFSVTLVLLAAFVPSGFSGEENSVKGRLHFASPPSAHGLEPRADTASEAPEKPGASSAVTNRLAKEKSPYLLQHKDNPVDWYPWGEEAFEKARREDKPVFLSIGYSTCHWCHVMEEESFENPAVAKVMNENFVSIKVDREERPDLDNVYMTAVQALAGSGGWPLSVFLTPEKKPFFGGTYWPPEDRWGRPGFISILNSVQESWKTNRAGLLRQSDKLVQTIRHRADRTVPDERAANRRLTNRRRAESKVEASFSLNEATLRTAFQDLRSAFDETHGGFGQGIKFPRSHTLSFLLRFWKRAGEKGALEMVERTLISMARGGMWDHLGGGFHRYSTDSRWFLPHFEKMLYDQALLSKTYLEAYQATRREDYAKTAREIFEYVLRDLKDPAGGFYSAEDADSLDPKAGRKREGAFYVWEQSETIEILGEADGAVFSRVYDVLPDGNVEQDPQGEFPKKNVLSPVRGVEEAAREFKKPVVEIEKILEASRRKLFEARSRRTRPHRDDKILTDWNGLMISSLAFGSRVLKEPRYGAAAQEAADFILEKLVQKNGRLLHRYREGEAAIPGTLEDYAFFVHGLFDLYEATFEARYLAEARRLSEEMIRLFWDEARGGFFLTAEDAEKLIVRPKEIYDGAIPSGNSVAALDLLRVGRLTMTKEFEKKAELLFGSFSSQVRQNPEAHPQLLLALDFALGPSREIVIAGDESEAGTQKFLESVWDRFFPNQVVAFHPRDAAARGEIEKLAPFIVNQLPVKEKPTAYLCQNYVCKFPVTGLSEFEKLLEA